MLAQNGALADMISSGAHILECACGLCIWMGQAPKSGGVFLRTFNRNFEGRSGTPDAQVYLVSPETAVASALTGYILACDKVCDPNFIYGRSRPKRYAHCLEPEILIRFPK